MDLIDGELDEDEGVHVFEPVVVLEDDNNPAFVGGTIEEIENEVGDLKGT